MPGFWQNIRMATYEVNRAKHATTTANVVDIVVLKYVANGFDVINLGPSSLYLSFSETNPTVAGDDFDIVPAGAAQFYPDSDRHLPAIKIISGSATTYSVVAR